MQPDEQMLMLTRPCVLSADRRYNLDICTERKACSALEVTAQCDLLYCWPESTHASK